jgi:hypothetical protein
MQTLPDFTAYQIRKKDYSTRSKYSGIGIKTPKFDFETVSNTMSATASHFCNGGLVFDLLIAASGHER